jgi:hypothetical protein
MTMPETRVDDRRCQLHPETRRRPGAHLAAQSGVVELSREPGLGVRQRQQALQSRPHLSEDAANIGRRFDRTSASPPYPVFSPLKPTTGQPMSEPSPSIPAKLAIESLAIAGYRSFGSEIQRFPKFAKVNILIGENNSGKSNVLRFIHERLQRHNDEKGRAIQQGDLHLPGGAQFKLGMALSLNEDISDAAQEVAKRFQMAKGLAEIGILEQLMEHARDSMGTKLAWYDVDEGGHPFMDFWSPVADGLSENDLFKLWNRATRTSGGDRQFWTSDLVRKMGVGIPTFESHLIPAIRKVGAKGTEANDFGGEGLIARLNRLQHPRADRQADKALFRQIQDFVRVVLSNPTAQIEIPHDLDTINVELDGKTLPIEALGTGIHEVIILAAAATVLSGAVVCMEEPEMHLHPLLQKKLMRYIQARTDNQYFITTHSAALMDTPGAEVYHLDMRDGQTRVERVSSDSHRSQICAALGYHPSDLLQSNCVIWVEGPSDRIYIEWWISGFDPRLVEGIHYSMMFYGGRLASHLSADDEAAGDFILLRRLNRRGVITMDSDRAVAADGLNATKERLRTEFDTGPGHAFITAGREIENYVDPNILKAAIARAHPLLSPTTSLGEFDNCLRLTSATGDAREGNKVKVASLVTEMSTPGFDRLGLRDEIAKLVAFIVDSNPPIET